MSIKKLFLMILPLIALVSACIPEHSKIVVAEFGKNKIYMNEFEKAYAKNSGGIDKAKEDSISNYKKFLDLYVNYRMKLRDAFVRGYYSDADMKKELMDYKANIGSTLYLNDELIKPGVKELYDRRKFEFRAAHIMLRPDSSMNEEQVINLGNELINRINNGESFEELAKKYSKDPYSKDKGGDVGYVTAGEITIPDIEDAIYSTSPGSIYPKLLKSNFAYHIIKVIEKLPRRFMIRAQHILASSRDSLGNVDTLKAYNKILEVQKKLQAGEDFGELAKQYSDDKYSAKKNGDIGFFSRHRMVPEFENAAFKLKVGEISPIIKTNYGYHIIKVTDEKPLPTFDESKDELEKTYKNIRYKTDLAKLKNKLKQQSKFEIKEDVYKRIVSSLDTIKIANAYWQTKIHSDLGNAVIFNVNNNGAVCDSLFNFMQNKIDYSNLKLNENVLKQAIDDYAGELLIKEKAMNYDKVNPEFATLIEEYENGIYLFKILDEEVWSKVSIDSNMARNYYDKNKENFRWKDRVEFKEIHVNKDSLAQKIYSDALNGVDFDSLMAKYNQKSTKKNKSSKSELIEIGDNGLADAAFALEKIGSISKPIKHENGWSIIKLIRREPSRIKSFEEVRNEIMGILQEQESKRLEENYINKLKNLYHPKYYYDELSKAFKQ